VPKPPVGSLALHGFLWRIMRPFLTRTTTVPPAEEPRLPAVPLVIDGEQIQPHAAKTPSRLTGIHFDHLDKTKNLSGSPACKAELSYPEGNLPRLPRTYFPRPRAPISRGPAHLTTHTTHITHHFRRPPWPARQSRELRGRNGTTTGALR
jgi:hypothetical protein